MGNEFGTDMSTFNIVDYIWYIVGGIALFFIIVGFIADKTGLAKKTFSRDTKKADKKVKEPIVEEVKAPIVEEVKDDLVQETNEMNSDENVSFIEMPIVDMPVNEDISLVNNEEIENDNIIEGNEPLYISEEPELSTDDFTSIDSVFDTNEMGLNSVDSVELTDDEIVVENNSNENIWDDSINQVESDIAEADTMISDDSLEVAGTSPVNTEDVNAEVAENTEIDEDIDVNVFENSGVTTEPFTSEIASDNAEEEWGVEAVSHDIEDNDLADVELPNLDDIEINSEEDVWKF